MNVDALLFDIGGTVFDWRQPLTDTVHVIPALSTVEPAVFAAAWRERSLIEVEAIARETAPFRPFDEVLESSLDRVLENYGLADLAPGHRATLLRCWERMRAWPEARSALTRLRARYFVAPHTILSLRVAAFSSRAAGIEWDAIVCCDALGAMKLNPKSYQRALALLGREPHQACFVAAHPSDLREARALGMQTAYVQPRIYDYGDDYRDTGFEREFTLVTEDLADLADRLGA